MEEYETQLHRDMLADVERCRQLDLSEEENAESCFRISEKYWHRIQEYYKERKFKTESEEINFFRNVKPTFTSYIHYFLRVYEGVVSAPPGCKQAIDYWESETERFRQFCNKNREFVQYYEGNGHQYDDFYFLQRYNYKRADARSIIFGDKDFLSSHDHLVASYLGHKMYHEFAIAKIKALKTAVSG